MKEMRVRTDIWMRPAALLPRLEKAVLDSEQRRETRGADQHRADRPGHPIAKTAAAT
jgi:hypothetical protein